VAHDIRLFRRRTFTLGAVALASLGAVGLQPASGQDFFAGRTITIICGYPPGGGVDAGARLIAQHLPKFIPGAPGIIVQNMPGAGGLTAANHLYAKAERSGLVLGLPGRDWVLHPTLQLAGGQFDALKYSYIGSTGASNSFGWIAKDLRISSLGELKASPRKVVIGALTPNTLTASIPKLMAAEGFPLQVVVGYRGTAQILQAIEQGEVSGIITNLATFARRPDLMEKAVVRVFQTLREAKDLPVLDDIVSPEMRPVLKMINAPSTTGMPFIGPPEVPAERLAILRKAFLDMARDPGFVEDANRIGEPTQAPIDGARLHDIYAELISSATEATAAAYKDLTGQK
jgi:tripartite-type tricarboxylate transporter receptor subunit TctC